MKVVKCKFCGLAGNKDGRFIARKTSCEFHIATRLGMYAVKTEPKNQHCCIDGWYQRRKCIGVEGTFTPNEEPK